MMPNMPPRSMFQTLCPTSLALLLLAGCGGLGHRSVEEVAGEIEIPAGIERVRLEVENGRIDVAAGAGRTIAYAGGVRRAADTADDLAKIEAQPLQPQASPDPTDPTTLVVRAPHLPTGVVGIVAFEAGLHVPADMPLEIVVSRNGHVVLDHREAFSKVRTARGDLRFQSCRGGVQARTGAGNVIVFEHSGDLDVRTGAGDMQAFIDVPGDKLTLDTGKGTVQCHVPADLEFDVDARVEQGRISNDFGLEVRQEGEFGAAMTGRRGAANTTVILRSFSGYLQLIAQKSD